MEAAIDGHADEAGAHRRDDEPGDVVLGAAGAVQRDDHGPRALEPRGIRQQ